MGRVECFGVPGCRCWFFTGDHSPPHFHAAAPDDWEIRVFFLFEPATYDIKYQARKIPRAVLQGLLTAAREHRAELFGEWQRHQADD